MKQFPTGFPLGVLSPTRQVRQAVALQQSWSGEEQASSKIQIRESPNFDQRARLMRIQIDPETGAPTGESVPLPFFRWSQILYPRVVDDGKRLLFIEEESVNSIEVCSYPDEANGGFDLSPDGTRLAYARPDASFQAVVELAATDGIASSSVWSWVDVYCPLHGRLNR
jgi:hypothetical protein